MFKVRVPTAAGAALAALAAPLAAPFAAPLAVALATALSAAPAAADTLTLDQALDLAAQRSEAVRAARAGVTSATEAAAAAGRQPDPLLRAGVDNLPVTGADRFSTRREAMTMKRIALGQEWLSADKRSAQRAAAQAVVDRESVAVQVAAADARLQTAIAFVETYYATQALALSQAMEHHAHEARNAAQARLSSAAGNAQEVLAMSSASGLAADESADVRQQQHAARLSLERWTGRPVDELAAPAGLADVTEQAFVARHPELAAAQRDVELARHEAAAAAANRQPSWSWEVAYGQRTGSADLVSFGVSIPFPVAPAQRQDRETAARRALVDKAEARWAEATRAATAEYRSLASDAQRLAQRVQQVRSAVLVPAQQRTAVALAGYRSNQLNLMTVFEARHAEVEAGRRLLKLQRDLAMTQVRLAFKPLTEGDAR